MTDFSGKVISVLGYLNPDDLGVTLTHEHLNMLYNNAFVEPAREHQHRVNLPFSLENLGWIRQNPYSCKDNLCLKDKDAVLEDVQDFKANGGRTIVENSIRGLNRDIEFVKEIAEKTGVNIIAGTGYYLDSFLTDREHNASVEDLARVITRDIVEGFDDTGIKCGCIGEIGCSWPLTSTEKKVLQASAAVQKQLGCPVIIHPGRYREAPFEIIRILQEAGGDISKTVMSHLDRTIYDLGQLTEFAKMGSFCEYDLFGTETSSYQLAPDVDMPCDAERIQRIKHLIAEGFEDRIVIAHDIHTNHRLLKYGGHGYSHILTCVVPQMKGRGITQEVIDKILIHNPRAWLTFK